MKKKYEEQLKSSAKSDEEKLETALITRPKNKMKKLTELEVDDGSDFEVVQVMKKSKKKKKAVLDSDEESYHQESDDSAD